MRRASHGEIVLTLACPDKVGIVQVVAGFLADRGINIVESQQFADHVSDRFFMRVQASLPEAHSARGLAAAFEPLAARFEMTWAIHDTGERPTVLILVSQLGHCLNDLLYRHRIGALRANIAGVVSNHETHEHLTRSAGIEFHYLPVTPDTKAEQERRLCGLVDEFDVDLVILARYMQIISEPTVEYLSGRAINIHHSFLPSFKGARPYHQAFDRGVKLIGATAHYVTVDLDEGPIIEQEVARVDHSLGPDDLVAIGRDIECAALARAVSWHLDQRVMLNGNRTVVFR